MAPNAPVGALPQELRERLLRQIALPQMGEARQAAVARARFLVIGAGGLGSPALMYLAASGACRITIADDDAVSTSNLSRQLLHGADALGLNKAESACRTLPRFNPLLKAEAVPFRMESLEALLPLVEAADVVLDCTDNLAARHLVNRACRAARKPLVFGSAVRFSGQATTFDFRDPDSPCYRCLFDEDDAANDEKAANFGVFSPLTGVIGVIQAAEAVKIAAGIGPGLARRLLLADLLSMDFTIFACEKHADCPVCGGAR